MTLKVRVDRHQPSPRGNRRVPYRVFVHDETGELALVFFSAHTDYLNKALPVGETRYVSGKVEWFNGRPNMVHPDHIVDEAGFADMPLVEAIYPGTAGLAQKTLQKSIRAAIAKLPQIPEWTDRQLLARENWPGFGAALTKLHKPRDGLDLDPASQHRRRLAHDEFLAGQLALALTRERMRKSGGIAWKFNGTLSEKIRAAFHHPLTPSQTKAIAEIRADLSKPERMLRLLQGDVGSGKTIVALLAAASVIEGGAQAAIMAPTEILARQHFATIAPLCEASGIIVEILTGKEKGRIREDILARLASGETHILIGTHALFQGPVTFQQSGAGRD